MALKTADTSVDFEFLKSHLRMSDGDLEVLKNVHARFPIKVNEYYLSLIDVDDPSDPIRRMCIPDARELDSSGKADTSGEHTNTIIPGLQHKYPNTALVLTTDQCSMYCRHCFRKRLVGRDEDETVKDIGAVLHYIEEHGEINDVLLTGGDSLMNSNGTIERYLEGLNKIGHVRTIRFGTRIPVSNPARGLDKELLSMLHRYSQNKRMFIVTQFNHPKELTEDSRSVICAFRDCGLVIKNQAVLLKGVNDSEDTLAELMNGIVAAGINPYYLFQCRPVMGAKNIFQIPLARGVKIVDAAKNKLSGLAKCFRFVMSHETGKIEILGDLGDSQMLFKYHQAKDPAMRSKLFTRRIDVEDCWL